MQGSEPHKAPAQSLSKSPPKSLPTPSAADEEEEFHDCQDDGDNNDNADNGWGDEPWDALEAEPAPVKATRVKKASPERAKRGMQLGGRKKDPVATLAPQAQDDESSGWGEDLDDLQLDGPADSNSHDGWGTQEQELDLGGHTDGWGDEGWEKSASKVGVTARAAVKTEDDDKEARRLAREARKAKAEERRAAKTAGGGGGAKRKGLGAVKKD